MAALVAQAWPSIKGRRGTGFFVARSRAPCAAGPAACGRRSRFPMIEVIEAPFRPNSSGQQFDDDRSFIRLYRVHDRAGCSGGDARCPNCGTSCAASACVRPGSAFRSAGCCSARATGTSRPKCCSTRRPGPACRSRSRRSTTPCTSSRKPASCASSRWTAPRPISTPIPSEHHHFFLEDEGELVDMPTAGISVAELPEPPAGHGSGGRRGDRPPAPQGA